MKLHIKDHADRFMILDALSLIMATDPDTYHQMESLPWDITCGPEDIEKIASPQNGPLIVAGMAEQHNRYRGTDACTLALRDVPRPITTIFVDKVENNALNMQNAGYDVSVGQYLASVIVHEWAHARLPDGGNEFIACDRAIAWAQVARLPGLVAALQRNRQHITPNGDWASRQRN